MSDPAAPPIWYAQLETYLRQHAKPVHKYGHQRRLLILMRDIAANTPGLRYDWDVTFAAAYLHDLGVFVGHRPEDPTALEHWDHVAYACQNAPALLEDFGFPMHKLDHVLQCIREHQPEDDPQSIEATLLRDADILEQLGAIAVFRTASKLGSDTRFQSFSQALRSLEHALEALPSQLRLDASRDLAKPRIHALQQFILALSLETSPCLY